MFIWKSSTMLRPLCFVLLTSVILASCSQSVPSNGESVDSVSEPLETVKETITEEKSSTDEQEKQVSMPPISTIDLVNQVIEEEEPEQHTDVSQDEPDETLEEVSEEPPIEVESSTADKVEWDGDNTLTFNDLYASVGVRGIVLSDKVEALTNDEVEMSGFMAPPLTAGVRFFVLTKALMAVCPFCSTDADWPTDIVVVYLPDGEEMNPTEHPVKVTGTLDTGSFRDDDTGFVSLVRIYADKVEVLK